MEIRREAPGTTELPKGLEALGAEEVEAHRAVGDALFRGSSFGRLLGGAADQVEAKQLECIAEVSGTKPEVRQRVEEAKSRKDAAGKKERTARQTEEHLKKALRRLRETANSISSAEAGLQDIIEPEQPAFTDGLERAANSTVTSTHQIEDRRKATEKTAQDARTEGRTIKYREVVRQQLERVLPHLRARGRLADATGALFLIDRTQEELTLYQAGLVAVAKRVVREAGEDRPLREGIFQEAGVLEKIQKAADGVGARLARRLDKLVQSRVLREEGRFEAQVLGEQQRREIAIKQEAERACGIAEGILVVTPEAVTRAADQIRVLVERPGFGKRPLGDESLTTEGLRDYRDGRLGEIIDPVRRWIYEHFARRSVEEAIGCRVIVTGTGKERKTDFQPLSPGEEPAGTPLFAKLVECEALDIEFRRALHNTEPTDIEGVQTLVAALRTTDKLRQALLGAADARINSLFAADGVRSGALKVALAEGGAKAVYGAIAAAIIYWATYRLGVTPKLEQAELIRTEAQRILAAPDQLADLWRMIENLAPGLDLTELKVAISAHSSEFARAATTGIADKTGQLSSLLNSVLHLERLAAMGPPRAAELMEKAQMTTTLAQIIRIGGAAGGIAAGAASMTEVVRRAAGAPLRGARALVIGRFTRSV